MGRRRTIFCRIDLGAAAVVENCSDLELKEVRWMFCVGVSCNTLDSAEHLSYKDGMEIKP